MKYSRWLKCYEILISHCLLQHDTYQGSNTDRLQLPRPVHGPRILITLMCSLRNHTAGLILSCKVPYPSGALQRRGVLVVVVAGMPRTAGRLLRQGRNSTAGWGLPNKVIFATRVRMARGYRTSVSPLATSSMASSSVDIVHHATTEPRVPAQHCSESDGRLHMHCPLSERVNWERLCTWRLCSLFLGSVPCRALLSTTPHLRSPSHGGELLQ
jgi:hypothetical protein